MKSLKKEIAKLEQEIADLKQSIGNREEEIRHLKQNAFYLKKCADTPIKLKMMMDFDIKKKFERIERLIGDERLHCLVVLAKSFRILGNSLENFFQTESKANLTVEELFDFKKHFKMVTMAYLSAMAEMIENHDSLGMAKGKPVFCNCRAN